MNPEISVVIPAYNCEQYITTAIKSVLRQTYSNFEIIVIDDGSQDNTYKTVSSFDDKRLKLIKNQQNLGASAARNRGINQAKGNWIALLDSDDWYSPERLEKLLQAAQKYQVDLVADDLYLVHDGERTPWSTFLVAGKHDIFSPELIDAVRFVESDRLNSINLEANWSFGYTKPLIRRKFLIDRDIKYQTDIKVGEDFTIYLECLLQRARFLFIPQAYYFYRIHKSSLSDRSPTEYLCQSRWITRNFVANQETVKNNPQLHQALVKNLVLFEERLSYYRFVQSFKSKKLLDSLQKIIINPHISKDVAFKLLAILKQKVYSKAFIKKTSLAVKKKALVVVNS